MNNKVYSGIVVRLRPEKTTAAVEVVQLKHNYGKYPVRILTKKIVQTHNEYKEISLGDRVIIKSCRPISKTKRFKVEKIESKKN